MRSDPVRLVLLLLSSFVATSRVLAEERDAPHLERVDQARVRPYRETAISPDGKRVAWVEGLDGEGGEPSPHSGDLRRRPGERRRERRDGSRRATASPGAPNTRSPGRRTAGGSRSSPITTRRGSSRSTSLPAEGGEARRLTAVSGFLADPRWSPDGQRLGVLFTRTPPGRPARCSPGTAPTGVIDEKVSRATAEHDRAVASGEFRQVSPPDLYVYEYDWSPDGTQVRRDRGPRLGRQQLVHRPALHPSSMDDGRDAIDPGPEDAGRGAALVAGRPDDRVHRRPDER